MRHTPMLPLAALSLLSIGAAPPPAPALSLENVKMCGDAIVAPSAMILTGYGPGGFKVTANAAAQAFFDNGLQLGHAFAHQASIAAFVEARRLDPASAMAVWGEAWSSGPTINYGIDAKDVARLRAMVIVAEKLAANAPRREQQLIAALKLRYPDGTGAMVAHAEFAGAMDALAREYPADDAIAVLAADAWMIAALARDGDPDQGMLGKSVALLETVLARNPGYAPAIHFYIHGTEMMGDPGKAEKFADTLPRIAPSASHLVHMPSHTYYAIGRYQDAVDVNVRAAEIGQDNARTLKMPEPDGVWQMAYHSHNVHFALGSALISGDGKQALVVAEPMIAWSTRSDKLSPFVQAVLGEAYLSVARFGEPGAMAQVAAPARQHRLALAMWHYARGEAAIRAGDASLARREARAMRTGFRDIGGMKQTAIDLVRTGKLVLMGRAAMLDGKPTDAASFYTRAAAIEEAKPLSNYLDPPVWWYGVRRSLAAAMLASGDAAGAVREADVALKRRPHDPATLSVRAQALTALGRMDEAAKDRARSTSGWRGSPFVAAAI